MSQNRQGAGSRRETNHARAVLGLIGHDFGIHRGRPLPLGATLVRGGINFAVFSAHASAVTLVLFAPGGAQPAMEWPLDPRYNRTGDVWHAFVQGLDPGVEYAFRAELQPNPAPQLHCFDTSRLLLDPYARAIAGAPTWGAPPQYEARRGRVVEDAFDWGLDQPLNRHLADSVIYEVHVRGFSAHTSSQVKNPGTFRGLIEKIPYLEDLGVTALELLPVTEFDENDNPRVDPRSGERLRNYWGYQPLALFAPKASYAASGAAGGEVTEFKEMVKALHAAGIEVVLDMVFNHTGEGEETDPASSFRGLDNAIYYLVDPLTGRYLDFTACGNTLNCNHPVVRSLILECLRYWVTEMHVDGFRFDLASVLGRGRDGSVLQSPPLLESLAADPVLAHTKLIAEAWDAAGLYQVGSFPNWGRWAEWNGRFRDDVRRFLRGDPGMVPALATRLAGSSDLYQDDGRAPYHSVNFVTSHDGFTLRDLVSYQAKHNERNGEDNRDGHLDNLSFNCGVEGETHDAGVLAFRARQARNAAAILLLAQGAPMLLGGDEFGRTQGGNNNAYCQDNELSHFDWSLLRRNAELHRFVKGLIRLRRSHACLRRRSYEERAGHPWVAWQGTKRGTPDWSHEARFLAMRLFGTDATESDLFVMLNAQDAKARCELPPAARGARWHCALNTAAAAPLDIFDEGREPLLGDQDTLDVEPRSVVVLIGR